MKLNFTKILILSVVAIFAISAILCCCFTDKVKVAKSTSPCHQAEHETDSSQNTEECGCDQSLAIIKEDVAQNDTLVSVATFVIEQQSEVSFFDSSFVVAFQTHPQFYDTMPLYIKHSTLRI